MIMTQPLLHTLVCHTCYLFGLLVVQRWSFTEQCTSAEVNVVSAVISGILASTDLTFNSAIVKHVLHVQVEAIMLVFSLHLNPFAMPHKLDQG